MSNLKFEARGLISDYARKTYHKTKNILEINIRERRAAVEADLAARRGQLLTAERMLAQLPAQAGALRSERDRIASESIGGPFLDRSSVLDEGATETIGRNRQIIQAIDEVIADIPAAIEYWKAKRKELSA